jgi:hypothetical protein
MENPEGRIIVTRNGIQPRVGKNPRMKPDEKPVLGDPRRADVPPEWGDRATQIFAASAMKPPVVSPPLILVLVAPGLDYVVYIFERLFVEFSRFSRSIHAKIDDPLIRWSAGDISTVRPWAENIRIPPPRRIRWKRKPFPRSVAGNIKWSDLHGSLETDVRVFTQATRLRKVPSPAIELLSIQIGEDPRNALAIQTDRIIRDLR